MAQVVVSTPDLVLRAAREADRQAWLEAMQDPVQMALGAPAFVEPGRVVADLDERVEASRNALAVLAPGTLVAADAADDRFVGLVSWRFDVAAALRVADLGYLVHPAARGRGVATAALRMVSAWLTTDPDGPGLARLQLDHSTENPASCRVARSAGFEQAGVRRGFLPLRDPAAPGGVRRHDVCLHGLLAPSRAQ